MISGLNTDTEYQGKTYHIQTEDGGRRSPVITTQVFYKGAILFTKKTSYSDILKADIVENIVRDLMKQQHTQVIRELLSGKLLEKKPVQSPPSAPSTPATQPSLISLPPRDSVKKNLDDLILDYLVSKEEKDKA